MKYIKLVMPALAAILLFSECKKGADDPAISLRSRKARLTGDWRLKEGSASYTANYNGALYNYSFRFNGVKCEQIVTDYYGLNKMASFAYTLVVNLKKDGTFYFKELISGKTLEATGTWVFTQKTADTKNKEAVRMHIDNISSGSLSDDHLFNQLEADFTFKITELRNDKMVISGMKKLSVSNNPDANYSCDYELIQ